MAFCLIITGYIHRRLFIVHYKLRVLNVSRTVRPRITKFYKDIHTDLVHSHIEYDVISYFLLEARKTLKMPPPTSSGGIPQEQFK